jgi:hypothetical protein
MKLGRAAHREVLGVGSDFALTDKWEIFRAFAPAVMKSAGVKRSKDIVNPFT